MIVVSDSSPIIALSAVGHLALLRELYEKVLIPEAVRREIVEEGAGQPGAREVHEADWIVSTAPEDRALVESLSLELDEGESEAIALAVEHQAGLLLVDERRARRRAADLGLRVIGVLGVLIEAKRRRLVPEVRPILDALVLNAGFRIAEPIREKVLRIVGE